MDKWVFILLMLFLFHLEATRLNFAMTPKSRGPPSTAYSGPERCALPQGTEFRNGRQKRCRYIQSGHRGQCKSETKNKLTILNPPL